MVSLRSIKRIREIVSVLLKYEVHYLIEGFGLKMYIPMHKRLKRVKANLTQPETFRHAFEDLGGAFIKLGQLLALRPDLIGEEYSKEFEKLLLDVPPEDAEVIKKLVKGLPLKSFQSKPLGSASIAQVHKAVLHGKTVAVKIKKPGVDEKFKEDIEIMESLAKRLKEKYDPKLIDPVEIVEEFKKYTEKELNLRHEATNIKRFGANFRNSRHVRIPKVYDEYSSNGILVMEYMEGRNILNARSKNKGVIKKVTTAVYKMLFEDRFFHADLHPGNIFIHKGKIIFLDFGIAGHLDRDLEKKLFNLFSSMVEGKLENTAEALLDLNIGSEISNEQILKDGLYDVLVDFYDKSLENMSFGKIFYGCIDVAKRSRIKLPAQIILFGKSLITMDGFCREVDPTFNVVANAKPYVHRVIRKRMTIRNAYKQVKNVSVQFYQSLIEVPNSLKRMSKMLGRFEERIIDIDNTFRLLTGLIWKVSKLLISTVLFATFFISSIILLDRPPLYGGNSVYSLIGFVLSAVFFVNIFRLFSKKD